MKQMWLLAAALGLCGCRPHISQAWVNVDKVISDAGVQQAGQIRSPSPPAPFSSESYGIQGRPPTTVVVPGADKQSADINRQVEESQEAALKLLRSRLREIYGQQANLFAEQQLRLLGDPTSKRLSEIRPKFLAAFKAYADKRLPLLFKLTILAGYPDTNPTNAPPPPNSRPVPKMFWLQANGIRDQLAALDKAFDKTATDLIASAVDASAQDRLAVLKKIEEFRAAMNERALNEAVDPLRGKSRNIVLQLAQAQPMTLPSEVPESVAWPKLQALPTVPRVDSSQGLPDIARDRLLIQKQLEIWLALTRRSLASHASRGIPDLTQEFEDWRRRQTVGH